MRTPQTTADGPSTSLLKRTEAQSQQRKSESEPAEEETMEKFHGAQLWEQCPPTRARMVGAAFY